MLISGQTNRIWHYWAGRNPGSVGVLLSPSYHERIPLDPWMPFAVDNGAFIAWRDKKEWDKAGWWKMLERIKMTRLQPLWVAVPDVVGNRGATLESWDKWYPGVKDFGWPLAFCVQDGMTTKDVPEEADVVFVGGTDRWKFPNLSKWCAAFDRVHCARVSSEQMLNACDQLGCESVDSTAWFREPSRSDKIPMLKRFIEGHRNNHPELFPA